MIEYVHRSANDDALQVRLMKWILASKPYIRTSYSSRYDSVPFILYSFNPDFHGVTFSVEGSSSDPTPRRDIVAAQGCNADACCRQVDRRWYLISSR